MNFSAQSMSILVKYKKLLEFYTEIECPIEIDPKKEESYHIFVHSSQDGFLPRMLQLAMIGDSLLALGVVRSCVEKGYSCGDTTTIKSKFLANETMNFFIIQKGWGKYIIAQNMSTHVRASFFEAVIGWLYTNKCFYQIIAILDEYINITHEMLHYKGKFELNRKQFADWLS
jgi:hypothetical protein